MVIKKIYYHISHLSGLTEILPFKGKVFVTTKEHIPFWVGWVRHKHDIPAESVYVYEVEVPQGAEIGVGIDGKENSDFFVVIDKPLPVKRVEWDLQRNCPKKIHKNKYKKQG